MHPTIDIIRKQSPHLDWIADGLVLLVRHGSHAYNTNVEGSDEDFKGAAIPPLKYFFGFQHKFEQAELKAPNPDTCIYHLIKFFGLAAVCNPNIIEVLYTDPSDHIFISKIGQKLFDIRNSFLSKRVRYTMCGYAYSQLQKIKRHRQWILNPPKEQPYRKDFGLPEIAQISTAQYSAIEAEINKELEKFQFDFLHDVSEPTKIAIQNAWRETLVALKIGGDAEWITAARKVGIGDNFLELLASERRYRKASGDWNKFLNWKKTRNPARYALEEKYGYDCKHGYHLVRLMRMCREILTTGKVMVKRPDREELLAIRNGAWSFDKLIDFTEQEEKTIQQVYSESKVLPREPNYVYLDRACTSLVADSFNIDI